MDRQIRMWGGKPASPVVILLAGRAGVGKTTTACLMVNSLTMKGISACKVAFADAIKKCAREYFGWDGQKDEKGRKLLQLLGTDVGRWYNEDVWANYTINHLPSDGFGLPPYFTIIDDWRFPNEYSVFIHNPIYQVFTVRIDAPEREILKGTPQYDHPSETSLEGFIFDEVFDNSGDMLELVKKVDNFFERRIPEWT